MHALQTDHGDKKYIDQCHIVFQFFSFPHASPWSDRDIPISDHLTPSISSIPVTTPRTSIAQHKCLTQITSSSIIRISTNPTPLLFTPNHHNPSPHPTSPHLVPLAPHKLNHNTMEVMQRSSTFPFREPNQDKRPASVNPFPLLLRSFSFSLC